MVDQKLEDLINQGLSAFYRERHEDAENIFLDALKLDPDNAEVNYQLGSACYYQDKINDALNYYKKAVELAPDDPHYHFVLGFSLLANENLAEAASALERSINLNETDVQVYKNLGETYYLLNEYEKSTESFKKVLEMDPQLDNYIYLYLSLNKADKTEEAKEILQKAKININKADAHYLILRLHMGFIEPDILLEKMGESVIPCIQYYHCGMSLLFNDENKKACEYFQKCIDSKLSYIPEFRRAQHELDNAALCPGH